MNQRFNYKKLFILPLLGFLTQDSNAYLIGEHSKVSTSDKSGMSNHNIVKRVNNLKGVNIDKCCPKISSSKCTKSKLRN
jgi:hypothetical protein